MGKLQVYSAGLRRLYEPYEDGQIIKSKVSINRSILKTALLSEIPMTQAQHLTILTMETIARKGAKLGRERPCVFLAGTSGHPVLAPLTALDGYNPVLASSVTQHYLIPVNNTPMPINTPWPPGESPRVHVEPCSLWPRGDCGYLLGITGPVPPRFSHAGLVESIHGEPTAFRVPVDDLEQILDWSQRLRDMVDGWSQEKKLRIAATSLTHEELIRLVESLESTIIAANGATPSQLQALDMAYKQHMDAIALAQDRPPTAFVGGFPPNCLQESSHLRWFLEAETLEAFSHEHPDLSEKQAEQIELVQNAVDRLCAGPALPQEFDNLVRLFEEIITVIGASHPALLKMNPARLAILLRNDDDLRNAIRKTWNRPKRSWPLDAIIYYVQQPVNV